MDLVYVPEVISYGFMRSVQYRDYEQPWNKNYFERGPTAYEQHCQRQLQAKTTSKSCDLCKQNKRRSLASYIKQKVQKNGCSEIREEEEAEEASSKDGKKKLPKPDI